MNESESVKVPGVFLGHGARRHIMPFFRSPRPRCVFNVIMLLLLLTMFLVAFKKIYF